MPTALFNSLSDGVFIGLKELNKSMQRVIDFDQEKILFTDHDKDFVDLREYCRFLSLNSQMFINRISFNISYQKMLDKTAVGFAEVRLLSGAVVQMSEVDNKICEANERFLQFAVKFLKSSQFAAAQRSKAFPR